jgi:hypothetical protein
MVGVIFMIVFTCVAGWMLYGFIKTRIAFFKELIPLDKYDGKFKTLLSQGVAYLRVNHPLKKFDVCIYVGTDHDRDSYPAHWGWFMRHVINLNQNQLGDLSWMKDFNYVARAWGLPESKDERDNALFLLFHEYRHLMQGEDGMILDFHCLKDGSLPYENPWLYRMKPDESDADWFAYSQLARYIGVPL